MKITDKLQLIDIDALVPYINNARTHSEEQISLLRGSLREFGFVSPVIVDGALNVIAGHGRIMAAKAEGIVQVPCVLVEHLTDAQRRAYILADNRLAEHAGWDEQLVALELEQLRDVGFDFSMTGFDESDIVLDTDIEIFEDEDFDPNPPKIAKAKRGDVFVLGRHRLMCGDATVSQDIATLMSGVKADLLLTDPPYNVSITKRTKAALTILNDSFKDDNEFKNFLAQAFAVALPHIVPGGGFYIWHSDGEQGWAFRQACREVGLKIRQCLVWEKQSATMGRQDYQWKHEPCLHGNTDITQPHQEDCNSDMIAEHDSCMYGWADGRAHLWCSDRKQTTVLHFDRPSKSEQHPTMKPVKLIAYQMCNSTMPKAIVLDMFGGSGTTMIAAEQTGRTAYVMELDPCYVDVIVARWEAFTGQKAEVVL